MSGETHFCGKIEAFHTTVPRTKERGKSSIDCSPEIGFHSCLQSFQLEFSTEAKLYIIHRAEGNFQLS